MFRPLLVVNTFVDMHGTLGRSACGCSYILGMYCMLGQVYQGRYDGVDMLKQVH